MTLNPILNNSTDNPSRHVFISYARDASHGQQLAEALHTELLNTGIPVFRDVGGINPGVSLSLVLSL
ncbi:MAG: hypothetical protein R3F02_09180 [Thiolinea sp.]